jgi:hypothetical protein
MVGTKRKCGEKKAGGRTRRSRYVGVSWFERDQKWEAKIQVRGVKQHLGLFHDEADGGRAYDAAVAAQNLRYPRNFPGDTGAGQAVKRRDNRSAIPDKGKSRFVGVCWNKRDKKWMVRATDKGKKKHIGYYDDETAAARAFDAYVVANKINTDLNFPSAPGAAGHMTSKKGRTSSHRGVSWDKRRKKWRAAITVDGKRKSLGYFVDADDAGRAYDAAIRKYFPVERPHMWKRFNFPSADGEEGSADGGDDAGSARGGASSSCTAVAARAEEEEDASLSEEEEPPRRRRYHRHRHTGTFAQARADEEQFYVLLRAAYDKTEW